MGHLPYQLVQDFSINSMICEILFLFHEKNMLQALFYVQVATWVFLPRIANIWDF